MVPMPKMLRATRSGIVWAAIVAVFAQPSSARAITAEEVSRKLNQLLEVGDTLGFQRFADENSCLLNRALTLILRSYGRSRYSATPEKLRKANTHITLLLHRPNGVSDYHRSMAEAVLNKWNRADYESYERALNLRRLAARADTPGREDLLRESSRLFRRLGRHDEMAENEYAHGELLYSSERYASAVPRFREALRIASQISDADLLCRTHLALASTLGTLLGRFPDAVEEAEHSREIIDRCDLEHYRLNYYQRLGVVYFRLGDYRTAHSHFRAADSVATAGSSPKERLYPIKLLALCSQLRGRLREADSIYSEGICLAQELDRAQDQSWMTVYQADVRITSRDTVGLRDRLSMAQETLLGADDHEGVAIANYELGRLQVLAGQLIEALSTLHLAVDSLGDPKDRIYAVKELGLAFLGRGIADSALHYLRISSALLDSVRSEIPRAELRRNYLRDKDDIIYGLVQANLMKGDTLAAFDVAEAHRARAFFEAIEEKRSHSDLPRRFARESRRLRDEISRLFGDIRSCTFTDFESVTLEDRLNAIQDSLSDLDLRAAASHPASSKQRPSDHGWFRRSTDSGVVSLYYLVHKDDFIVWYTDGVTIKARTISDDCSSIRKRAESALRLLREPPVKISDKRDLEDTLGGLRVLLPDEIRDRMPTLRGLRVYPSGVLCYLPLEVVRVGDSYLGEALPIEYFPSLSIAESQSRSLARKRSLETVAALGGGHFRGVANCREVLSGFPKAFSGLRDLPGADQEVRAIKAMFAGVKQFLNAPDQERSLKAGSLRDFDILHFVAHGIVLDDNPQFSGLVLPPSVGSKDDGILLTDEISALKLNSSLVVLSACETGLGAYAGGEGILGLSRSFILAGARSLVVSLWPIDDRSSGLFMGHFYQAVKGGQSTGEALWTTRKRMVAESPFKHPYYWAPLIALGDWK